MARSPIEMMVDKACGFDPSKAPPRITLRCPKCRRTKTAPKDASDPPGTAVVEAQCPECCGGDFDTPTYFNAEGREINFETGEPY